MKDIKTTIAGYVVGLPLIAKEILDAYVSGSFTGKSTLGIIAAIGIIILGHLASDSKPSTK